LAPKARPVSAEPAVLVCRAPPVWRPELDEARPAGSSLAPGAKRRTPAVHQAHPVRLAAQQAPGAPGGAPEQRRRLRSSSRSRSRRSSSSSSSSQQGRVGLGQRGHQVALLLLAPAGEDVAPRPDVEPARPPQLVQRRLGEVHVVWQAQRLQLVGPAGGVPPVGTAWKGRGRGGPGSRGQQARRCTARAALLQEAAAGRLQAARPGRRRGPGPTW
jgi:hypothetical protein